MCVNQETNDLLTVAMDGVALWHFQVQIDDDINRTQRYQLSS